jgi:hypothetical protein
MAIGRQFGNFLSRFWSSLPRTRETMIAAPTTHPQPDEDPNRHILEYLRFYCDPDNLFDFAVLLKGPLGVGKTYLINEFLRERAASSKNDLYVSLYGLSSFSQIDDELFRKTHPILSSKGMRILGNALKAGLRVGIRFDIAGGEKISDNLQLSEMELKSYFETPEGSLLIFDDLERCAMPVADVLGYINLFVEHEGLKVIILANEEQILKLPENEKSRYADIKEKLIGQTLEIHSAPKMALEHFLTLINDARTREFLVKQIPEIISLYQRSERQNLRALKQSLWDFERLAICFSERHWKNLDAVGVLFRVVLALSQAIRLGRMTPEQFMRIGTNRIWRLNETNELDFVTDLEKRYPEVRFDQTMIDLPLLRGILFEGRADHAAIRSALDRSPYYASPAAQPTWRVAWHIGSVDDAEYEQAVAEVEEQFKNREFVIPGEIGHVIGLRLLFAEMGVISAGSEVLIGQFKHYVDDLRSQGKIPNKYGGEIDYDPQNGWDGLRIFNRDTREFGEIWAYYQTIIDEVGEEILPELGRKLLGVMKSNPEKFFRALVLNDFEPSPYYNVPILASIPPKDFVDHVLSLDFASQAEIIHTFRSRYERNLLENELAREKPWLKEVKEILEQKARALGPITRYRINNLTKRNIDPFLEETRSAG